MGRLIKTAAAIIFAFCIQTSARIINIPADYATIQAGIDASQDGDTVLVGPGEYPEVLTIRGQQILLTSSNGPYETTIIGHMVIRDFAPDTFGCVFQGFTLFDTNHDPWRGVSGLVIVSGKSKILGNIIRGHYANSSGAGIYSHYWPAIISHNIIESNFAMGAGGGLCLSENTYSEISYNIIRNNISGGAPDGIGIGWAAGIYIGKGKISYNLIYQNVVDCYTPPGHSCGDGGGVMAGNDVSIYNNSIILNTALMNGSEGDGGGIITSRIPGDTSRIINNIIAFNNRGGLIIGFGQPESLYVNPESYNLFYGNTAYDISAPETSQTDIFADPMFTDTASRDFSLRPGSPAIDAGDPTFPLDPDSTRVDIGALFFDQGTVIDDSIKALPYKFAFHQNYPNPFNAQTTLSYTLDVKSEVSLIIFDITGRLVKTIVQGEIQTPGEHQYVWDGNDNSGKAVSTAIYFCQLKIEGQKLVKSMILIK